MYSHTIGEKERDEIELLLGDLFIYVLFVTTHVVTTSFDMAIMPLLGDITKKQRSLSHLLLMVQHTPSIAHIVVLHTPLMGLFMIIFDMAIMPHTAPAFLIVLIGLLCDFIIGLEERKEERETMAADNNNNNQSSVCIFFFLLFCFCVCVNFFVLGIN